MMLRSFKSATGEGGGPGAFVGTGTGTFVWAVAIDTLLAAASVTVPVGGGATGFVRTTMLVLTRMGDLRGAGSRRASKAAGDTFASPTSTRRSRLLHHFQKNHTEHDRDATASKA